MSYAEYELWLNDVEIFLNFWVLVLLATSFVGFSLLLATASYWMFAGGALFCAPGVHGKWNIKGFGVLAAVCCSFGAILPCRCYGLDSSLVSMQTCPCAEFGFAKLVFEDLGVHVCCFYCSSAKLALQSWLCMYLGN
ncbi:hypothetical protein U1Q18_032771 [Sarracenia purpurea var. burkii]